MGRFIQTIHDLRSSQARLASRPYGVIVAEQGAFQSVQIRPFPKLSSLAESFTSRRTRQRDELFRLQDELRRELTEDEWTLAAKALSASQNAYARPKVGGA